MTSTEPGSGTLQYQRQREIYSLALTTGSVDVAALARLFNVTTETIRRDLSDLQGRQLLRRVHGGAVPFERRDHEPMIDARGMLNAEEKLTVFLVEQNAFHALKLAHRAYVMVNGTITMSGTGKELLARPEIRAAYLEGGRH